MKKKKSKEKKPSQIRVTVQQADRLAAIVSLSSAIEKVAMALASNVEVYVIDNAFFSEDSTPGMVIDTDENVNETQIYSPVKD